MEDRLFDQLNPVLCVVCCALSIVCSALCFVFCVLGVRQTRVGAMQIVGVKLDCLFPLASFFEFQTR